MSSGVTIAAFTTALLSPACGVAIDRFGSRRVALPGLVATMIAICAFSLANGSAIQWLALWEFYAVISIAVKTTVWISAIARVFDKGRGFALGLTLCGTAAAQSIAPPLGEALIAEFGWRMAYVNLGLGWGAAINIDGQIAGKELRSTSIASQQQLDAFFKIALESLNQL